MPVVTARLLAGQAIPCNPSHGKCDPGRVPELGLIRLNVVWVEKLLKYRVIYPSMTAVKLNAKRRH